MTTARTEVKDRHRLISSICRLEADNLSDEELSEVASLVDEARKKGH